ncbi:MAG: hypothetical protein HYU69_14460, partial [Bacteroidetes bacterium]|nr:hypothetical protein [Bacteroidota bacterium]
MKKYFTGISGVVAVCVVFLITNRAIAQNQCSSPSPLTIGTDDTQCNSESFNGLITKLKNNTTPITTVGGSACGLNTESYAKWYSFTGDGNKIRFKLYGQDKISSVTVFENQTCGATMTAKDCGSYADDNMPHVIDINTTNGATYLIAVSGGSSTMKGNVCAYITNGNAYSP